MPRRNSAPKRAASAAVAASNSDGVAAAAAPARVIHAGRLARIEHIHARLREVRAGGRLKVTVNSLAAELGRGASTIFDDLAAMKESFGAPIRYDPVRGTQYYAEEPGARPFELHPRVWLDAAEALAMMVAARRLFPLGTHVEKALQKILPLVDGAVTLDPATLEAVCSTPENPATEADVQAFVFLFQAIRRSQEVRLEYRKLAPGAKPEVRTVRPLHLVIFADSCVLVAHDRACDDRRNFDLARIREPRLTGRTFVAPAGFDLKTYLAGGMGAFLGEARHQIRVRFAPGYVSYVRQRPWHVSQVLVEQPDGGAEATYRVAHTAMIEQRVLAAGGQAEVIAPREVRERVRAAARGLVEQHG
jgi:predicted DNA-binding transcriptional regulator YafY